MTRQVYMIRRVDAEELTHIAGGGSWCLDGRRGPRLKRLGYIESARSGRGVRITELGKLALEGYHGRLEGRVMYEPKATDHSEPKATDHSEPQPIGGTAFRRDLVEIINRHSTENTSGTPDFILAEYLAGCLRCYDRAVTHRERWYGRDATKTITAQRDADHV